MGFLEGMLFNPLRMLRVYLLGRGLLTLSVIIAGSIGGLMPALVVGIGGALFSGFMRINNTRLYEDQMVNLYRDDIAQHLGIAPEQVTRAHLREAAKDNDVIDQALQRQRSRDTIGFATTALAGLATVALLTVTLGGVTLPVALGNFFTGIDWIGNGTLGSILKYASTGIIAGFSSLVFHDGLEMLIGQKTGVAKAAAHDRIVEMERSVSRGQAISKEQVYGVLIAGNSTLEANIRSEFGKSYADMMPNERAQVLVSIGVADEMQTIATEINGKRLRPASLAYMMNEAMPRPNRSESVSSPAQQPVRSHVAALGRPSREEDLSHVARLETERAALAERSL